MYSAPNFDILYTFGITISVQTWTKTGTEETPRIKMTTSSSNYTKIVKRKGRKDRGARGSRNTGRSNPTGNLPPILTTAIKCPPGRGSGTAILQCNLSFNTLEAPLYSSTTRPSSGPSSTPPGPARGWTWWTSRSCLANSDFEWRLVRTSPEEKQSVKCNPEPLQVLILKVL